MLSYLSFSSFPPHIAVSAYAGRFSVPHSPHPQPDGVSAPSLAGKHQNTQRQVQRPRSLTSEQKVRHRGTNYEDIGNPLVDS